jgi:hypothetical protein
MIERIGGTYPPGRSKSTSYKDLVWTVATASDESLDLADQTSQTLARISHQGPGWRFSAPAFHRIRASLHIIAQGFGFTRDFTLKGTEV